MQIYLMRHGSNHPKSQDPEEGLTQAGREQARRAGRALAALGVGVDRVIASPKTRARQTAALAAEALGYDVATIAQSPALKPMAEPQDTLEAVLELKAPRVLVVGHLPSLGRVASVLMGGPQDMSWGFEPTTCCFIEAVTPGVSPGTLRWFLDPEALAAISP